MIKLKPARRAAAIGSRDPRKRVFRLGLSVFVAFGLAIGLLAIKPQIMSFFDTGETVVAEFARDYKLRPKLSGVKQEGLVVGTVTDVEHTENKTVVVTMKIDDSAYDVLGPEPSASIEPRTVLGGRYVVELARGGGTGEYDGATIPLDRTRTPVELDRVTEALPSDARDSVRRLVKSLDSTLANGGSDAARDLVKNAPKALKPAGDVLSAARGTRPGVDLPQAVRGLTSVAETLTERDGQLDTITTSLHTTARTLANQREPLASTIHTLPGVLRDARSGLNGLDGSLERLTRTATKLRPTAGELTRLVDRLDPVLRDLRPLLSDLRPLLRDARPAVDQLVPVARQGTEVLRTIRGPVLDRVNGPVMDTLLSTWRGKGPYEGNGGGMQADHKFYEELAYMATNIDRASMTQDVNGSTLGFQVGAGAGSIAGTPFNLENLTKYVRQAGGAR